MSEAQAVGWRLETRKGGSQDRLLSLRSLSLWVTVAQSYSGPRGESAECASGLSRLRTRPSRVFTNSHSSGAINSQAPLAYLEHAPMTAKALGRGSQMLVMELVCLHRTGEAETLIKLS